MLRKHKISKYIKDRIKKLYHSNIQLWSIYDIYVECENIKTRIRFYETDKRMINTLNNYIYLYSKYYRISYKLYSITKENTDTKFTFPFIYKFKSLKV